MAWTGEQLVVWGGEQRAEGRPSDRGGVLDPGANVWFSLPPAPIAPRSGATALWTGSEVLILGGDSPDGVAYDPATRLWRELPAAPIPPDDVIVWTGTEAILFGGWGRNGLALNVADDTWRPLADAPDLEWDKTGGVWTGTEMIVWNDPIRGGVFGERSTLNVVAYDAAADSWRQLAPPDDPIELAGVTGVWTGEEVILWGIGDITTDGVYSGLALNPATDEWRLIAPPPSPAFEVFWNAPGESAVWTGSRMLVWHLIPGNVGPEIWAYDPASDLWERGASSPVASNPTLIWTGDTLYAYGGGEVLFRTLSLDLGPEGDELPDPVGSQSTIDDPPVPFELLAVAANTRRAAVFDLWSSVATVHEPLENLLPPDAIDGAAPAGDGWVTWANGAVWSYPNGIASQPFVLQSEPTVERPGFAPAVSTLPARGDQHSGWVWIVRAGNRWPATQHL